MAQAMMAPNTKKTGHSVVLAAEGAKAWRGIWPLMLGRNIGLSVDRR